MNDSELQQIIDELQRLIIDTQATLSRFEHEGMEKEMADDYNKLLNILNDAVKQQRKHTSEMLSD